MKKLFIYALAGALSVSTLSAQTAQDPVQPKREAKTKKAKRSKPTTAAQPVFQKGPYADDPSSPRDKAPSKVKHAKKAKVKSTADEPKVLKVKKQRREARPVNGVN